jgi:hypothetical protein
MRSASHVLAAAPIAVSLSLLGLGCGHAEPPPITPEPPRAAADTKPPSPPEPEREPVCEPPHVLDRAAHACRLHPGGGNGWAGCSQASAPPNGEACITGTHWDQASCDCACDGKDERWDPKSSTCRVP